MKPLYANALLLLTAAVWGLAFVAQRVGMDYIGPFTFNALRFGLGGAALWGLIRLRGAGKLPAVESAAPASTPAGWRRWGLLLGAVLFGGASLQQAGLVYTTAGKAGFITGLYVVLVPLVSAWLGTRHGRNVWLGALLALAGLYLLSVTGAWRMAWGDFLVFLSALFWTAHVLLVDRLVARFDSLRLAALQFGTVAVLSAAVAVWREPLSAAGVRAALWAILYGGLLSVGVGYTLQLVAQQYAQPAAAAIILSLEAVFALLGGVLLLSEPLTARSALGCTLMLMGMLISQRMVSA
ncbi:MAG: DMT family transporter [Anaerolineales bacterium]